MSALAPAWSSLPLVAGLLFTPQESKWKEGFDYTRLEPSNTEMWTPLTQCKVQMEQAIEFLRSSEKGTLRVMRAELDPEEEQPTWRFEVFLGDGEKDYKRVNIRVSTQEPKIIRRLELNSLTDPERELAEELKKVEVPAEVAIKICKDNLEEVHSREVPLTNTRIRLLRLDPESKTPRWNVQLMGTEGPDDAQRIKRIEFVISGASPRMKQKQLIDRFAGEPLRWSEPIEVENGMYLHDFVVGDGEVVSAETRVEVNYRLFLLDNTKIHDTWKRKAPETFQISKAPLKGITLGMEGMRVGGRRKICMPYDLAFGEAGNNLAPPRAMVVCDVQVEKVLPPK